MNYVQTSLENRLDPPAPAPITNEMLKCSPDYLLEIELSFFNLCLNIELSSNVWCKVIITPIHKEGIKSDPENYRGICVMHTLLKLLYLMMNE